MGQAAPPDVLRVDHVSSQSPHSSLRRRHGSAGPENGKNRTKSVGQFASPCDEKTPSAAIEWRENGHRLSRSLGHRDWAWAKTQADQFAADFNGPEFHGEVPAEPEPLTLETRIS